MAQNQTLVKASGLTFTKQAKNVVPQFLYNLSIPSDIMEENQPTKNKTTVWVKAPCDSKIRKTLTTTFDKYLFVFGTNDIGSSLKSEEIIIGEPSETGVS